jgi:hypothetical protein
VIQDDNTKMGIPDASLSITFTPPEELLEELN